MTEGPKVRIVFNEYGKGEWGSRRWVVKVILTHRKRHSFAGEILQRCKQDLRGTISREAHGSRLAAATYEKRRRRRRRRRRVGGGRRGGGEAIGKVRCSKEISRDAGSCTGPPINDVP
ncbi:hypothetical protein V1478_000669 [Vespula squamosa]|uniref:Uncharacterized protein n=1 Tax=Vespula squamosa TaxID=30214 RepID=A0ABD2C662_VESSQ